MYPKLANRVFCTQSITTIMYFDKIKKYLLSSSVPGKTLESSSDADFCLRKSLDFGVHFPASIWQSGWTFIRHNLHFNPCRVWPKKINSKSQKISLIWKSPGRHRITWWNKIPSQKGKHKIGIQLMVNGHTNNRGGQRSVNYLTSSKYYYLITNYNTKNVGCS